VTSNIRIHLTTSRGKRKREEDRGGKKAISLVTGKRAKRREKKTMRDMSTVVVLGRREARPRSEKERGKTDRQPGPRPIEGEEKKEIFKCPG